MKVKIEDIAWDLTIQCRENINMEAVKDYAERIEDGETPPPITLFKSDDGRYYVGDGWHRLNAYKNLDILECEADIRPGGREAAFWFACLANRDNGVHRTSADKRKTVQLILTEYPQLSSRQIAERAGVSHHTVDAVRGSIGRLPNAPVTTKDGRQYPAKRKPGRPPKPQPQPEEVASDDEEDLIDPDEVEYEEEPEPDTRTVEERVAASVAKYPPPCVAWTLADAGIKSFALIQRRDTQFSDAVKTVYDWIKENWKDEFNGLGANMK